MSKELKIILYGLLGLFIIIQAIPSERPANDPVDGYDFFVANEVPDDIEKLIRTSCYDCHSQEVHYPWYSHVAPARWLVNRDVRIGRAHLDFSNWNDLSKKDKLQALSEIEEEVEIGTMPMAIYTLMHSEAKLSEEDREKIISWTEDLAEKVFEE